MSIYCGNNLNYKGLMDGSSILGTNYECLRKGIGMGRNMKYDENFSGIYNPIDNRKFYCGNKLVTPPNYFSMGSPSKCLQIGVGIGKSQKASLGMPVNEYFIKYILPYIILFTPLLFLFWILVGKPDYFYDRKKKQFLISKLIRYIGALWGILILIFFVIKKCN